MNMLFGTDFSVMMARTGRRQTTLGVWLGLAPPEANEEKDTDTVLVLDVEGTDSRERGEDHGAFERKTSLFSLALSEILIINMWVTDVGRHDGANYGLLKVVFELNLQLFQQSSGNKTLLLFLFRDHSQHEDDTPLEEFIKVITEDMEKIWSGISKTEAFSQSKVTDFFDFQFVSLPPKPHAPDRFKAQVAELKHRFLDPTNPNRLLSKNYKKDVPADGFARYAADIWGVIQENKDLNIPTQKEMLSMFRCEQMANSAFEAYSVTLDGLRANFSQEPSDDSPPALLTSLGSTSANAANVAYEQYNSGAKRYDPNVAEAKRGELTEKMAAEALSIVQLQFKHASTAVLASLKDLLTTKVTSLRAPVPGFKKIIEEITQSVKARWNTVLEDAAIPVPGFDRLFSSFIHQQAHTMTTAIGTQSEAVLQDQLKAQVVVASRGFEKSFAAWVSGYIEEGGAKTPNNTAPFPTYFPSGPAPITTSLTVKTTPGLADTWAAIATKFQELSTKFLSDMQADIEKQGLTNQHAESQRKEAEKQSGEVARKVLREISSRAAWLMERRFSNLFKFDANRIPRRWKPSDDLNGEFKKASLQAERLLDQISVLRLEPNERGFSWLEVQGNNTVIKPEVDAVPDDLAAIPLNEMGRILEQFRDKARSDYIQATHAQETAVQGSYTAIVALIMFLIFGWDEAMYLLTNPFALALVCVLVVSAFAAYHLGLFPVIAPVFNTVVSTVSQAIANAQGIKHAPVETPADSFSSSRATSSGNLRSSTGSPAPNKEKLD
jgi:hypothetical protein